MQEDENTPTGPSLQGSKGRKQKKLRKPLPKWLKIILTVIYSIAVLINWGIVFTIIIPLFNGIAKYLYFDCNFPANHVETSLTQEQRLKDFDYMYDIVCLQNPRKEYFEEAYGISYEDIYNRYREYVINAKSDYEFFSYLTCFLAVLPGQHNYMSFPKYDFSSVTGFELSEVYGTQEFNDYINSWVEEFRDDVADYSEYSLICFRYINGQYVGVALSATDRSCISDYELGRLISLDGNDPVDMCFDLFDRSVPVYDSGNDCFFRNVLLFNNGTGVRHTAEILMPDGETVTVDLYDDPCYDVYFTDGYSAYKTVEEHPEGDEPGENTPAPGIMDDDYVPTTYTIVPDEDRDLIYVESTNCETGEGERLVRDLTQTLESTGIDNIILDIRNNGGGEVDFVRYQLLPAIFDHDVQFNPQVIGRKNSYTSNYYFSTYSRLVDIVRGDDFPTTDFEYFYYTEDFSVEGKADKPYKIYLLTSTDTFSSGDIMTRLCKLYDNAVVVGTNTEGEGICGSPFNCYLPESHFAFVYVPTVNIDYVDDSIYGTEPDIYVPRTYEEYSRRIELKYVDGADPTSYEGRITWDQTLLSVIDMIENQDDYE